MRMIIVCGSGELRLIIHHALTGSDNEGIYSTSVKGLVQSAMEGYNGTVFAYGQTSSGKTYTMSGTSSQPGITPRAVEDVFKYIRENSEREFLLRVSYLEIYNECIRDLLSPEAIDLKIHEDRKRGVYVSPLKEEIVTTPSQVMRIIQRGDYQRHTSSTDYNAHSSRSHSIFQIVIESRERAPTAPRSPTIPGGRKMSLGLRSPSAVRVSHLNLIDLAGSEKASTDVERRKEGAFINKSLLTLGTVIAKLTDERGGHIPYRDSKLTRILQSSLSGNARVSVICTISPSFLNVEESHNTLKFAARVKKIITKAHTNQVMDDKALLEKYRREITELKAQLLLTAAAATGQQDPERGGGRPQMTAADSNLSHLLERERMKHEEEMIEMNLVRNALKERIDQLTKLILTSQSINTKGVPSSAGGLGERQVSSSSSAIGRYTVETTADGTVLEFPKEIESRLARKDTIVRQLQSELEAQQEKVALMKAALQKTAKGEAVDIVRTLAKVDMEPPREKFLIEKRASIMNLNGMVWQDAGGANVAAAGGGGTVGRSSGQGSVKRVLRDPYASPASAGAAMTTLPTAATPVSPNDDKDDTASLLILPDGEQLPIDDYDDDDDLMDTPWNRTELHSLRQAKRELEIVVIEQEKKLEDMVAFEDSDEFRNLVLELEEHREKIVGMEEEREGLRATITELRNNLRRFELAKGLENGNENGVGGGGRIPFSPPGSPSPSLSSPAQSVTTTTMSNTMNVAAASRIQELEQMFLREKKLRMEEQARNMGRIASLEAEVTILKAEQSIQDLP
ncbi:MAG: P-loop containing nucleoside triphosphate hydrolase protein [Linnemannia elongata]|nr:MAG: P-loop containing nucleoside triphosphate hydrolase protein [Linnemannia elongata]